MKVLSFGAKGELVSRLQDLLTKHGYYNGNIDGDFGDLTLVAVKNFQKDKSLLADGIVGKESWAHLDIDVNLNDEDLEMSIMREDNNGPLLWYPERVKIPGVVEKKMQTQGKFNEGYPTGAIVHYTAGRSRNRIEGGRLNKSTHFEQGLRTLDYAITENKYSYFIIARDGSVFQNFPLNEWGYHAGAAYWDGLGHNINSKTVGIEVMCAGRLDNKTGQGNRCPDGKMAAWFTNPESGDSYFDVETEVRTSKSKENIQAGSYHRYSEAQEKALINLLIWLESNGQGTFKLDYVLGHDEVAPTRKSDPGASLSMSMPEFRNYLKDVKVTNDYIKSQPLVD